MNKFSNKLKKLVFGPFWFHFQFLRQKKFSWKIWLSRTTSYGFLAWCQNLEKVNDTIQRKHPDRWKDGWKDGQTLFYRTLLALAGAPKSKKTFIQVADGNSLQILLLWMLLLPNQPNQAHHCWRWARQQSKKKTASVFQMLRFLKTSKNAIFFFRNTQKSRKN